MSGCNAQGNIQLMPSAGKLTTGVKRGKTCSRCRTRCQTRENMQLVQSAGEHAQWSCSGATEARENMHPASSARRHQKHLQRMFSVIKNESDYRRRSGAIQLSAGKHSTDAGQRRENAPSHDHWLWLSL